MKPRSKSYRFSLHLTISTLFMILVLTLGGVLVWQSYQRSSEIILSSAERLSEQMTEQTRLDFQGTYAPAARILQILAHSPVIDASSLEERLRHLPQLFAALGEEGVFNGIQIGYPDGDYFILRSLFTDGVNERYYSAPDDAAYVVDDISRGSRGQRQLTRLYFSRTLERLRQDEPVDTRFDPRRRLWYKMASERPQATPPYVFFFTGKVGITMTRKTPAQGVVIAIDVTLDHLSQTLARHVVTPHSELAIVSRNGIVVAYPDSDKLLQQHGGQLQLSNLETLGNPVLASLMPQHQTEGRQLDLVLDGRHWIGRIERIAEKSGLELYLVMAFPLDELLGQAFAIRGTLLTITGAIVLFFVPIVWLVAGRISRPLRRLAAEAEKIRRFEFATPIETRSFIHEVDLLAAAMDMMKKAIKQFVSLIDSLAGEQDFDALLDRITHETMVIGQARAAAVYLVDADETCLEPKSVHAQNGEREVLETIALQGASPLLEALEQSKPTLIRLGEPVARTQLPFADLTGDGEGVLVCFPLRNRQQELVGLLLLFYPHDGLNEADHQARLAHIQALSGFSAVSIESRQLLRMQEELLHAFIKVLADAIDAKSPYTGGHCQRVPELTRMLAEAACRSHDPAFESFDLSPSEWEALRIASWLHDCGKVTTPEYVVDKSTKLETIYDRIHEIRMRFEVLKRDAEIDYWRQLADGGGRESLDTELQARLSQLDEDFAFVAQCNLGGEAMDPAHLERLQAIARQTWRRTLDDRLGISWEERQRKERVPVRSLPVEEPLLADKPEHLIERDDRAVFGPGNRWGFRLEVPRYEYNHGELYNLMVTRGTLTSEERYKINEHIVQTIIMLERLPFPKHLREVPAIAGGHHETMVGTGYPRRLTRQQMPLTARIMAIADIFEALTASDRPYKAPKPLSEALRILAAMCDNGHIDPDLFRLFLESGVWRQYGEKFLDPEQLDEVDIEKLLSGRSG